MKRTLILVFIYNIIIYVDSSPFETYLKQIHYEKSQRPYFLEDKPVNVTLQLFIHTLGPIDEADFTFHLGFYMRQWWKDPRLIFNTTDITETTSLDHLIWIPDTAMADTEVSETFKNGIRTVINHVTGAVYVSRRLKATTKCEMNLKLYPMDQQICQLIFENYAFTTKNIEIFWHSDAVLKRDGLVLDGYKLMEVTSSTEKILYQVGDDVQYFKQLIANVKVERTYMYHVFRAYIPSILLLAFAFGTFWVPDTAVPARMGMIVTSFLSNTFILQGVTENTVKVSYTTPMQYFLVVTVGMIVLSLVEYLIILQLRRVSEGKATIEKVRKSSIIQTDHSLAYLNRSLVISYDGRRIHSNRRNHVKQQPPKMEEFKYQDTHVVDKISQILFPLSYFIFCSVYFIYYIHAND